MINSKSTERRRKFGYVVEIDSKIDVKLVFDVLSLLVVIYKLKT